jgi:hypothetical protein
MINFLFLVLASAQTICLNPVIQGLCKTSALADQRQVWEIARCFSSQHNAAPAAGMGNVTYIHLPCVL